MTFSCIWQSCCPLRSLPTCFYHGRQKKAYPFLNSDHHPTLEKEERKTIFKNVYAMFNHHVGATVLSSTDNLLISFFLGLKAVSRNDSYALIQMLLRSIFGTLFNSLNASVGNYHATKTEEETHTLFEALHFAGFWFYTFYTASFFLLVNPFITLVWGEKFLFSIPVVLLISVNFYIYGIRQISITFKEALGLLYQDRYFYQYGFHFPVGGALCSVALWFSPLHQRLLA